MRSGLRRSAALVALAAPLACAGIEGAELPAEPIAFVHRSLEQGRERAELLDPETRRQPTPGASILNMQGVMDYLTGSTPPAKLLETFGRMSLLDPRTQQVTRVEFTTPGALPLEWSGDHRQLRFMAVDGPRSSFVERDVESGELRTLSARPHIEPTGSVAADGRVALSRVVGTGKEARTRIWLRDPRGGTRPVSLGPTDYRPRWSPDGSLLVFGTQLAGGALGIAAVDPRQEAPPRVIARGRDPVFTPDGQWIVYSTQAGGAWRLWRMRPDGTGKGALGHGSVERVDEIQPAVSPDGHFVAYVARESGRERLRLRRFDGSGDRPLLEGGDGSNPVW